MLNPEGTYALTHRVELAECDPKDRMRLSWIMRLQQEAGEKQLLELGIGHQKLWEEGMVFLLSKMAVQILQTPRYLQEIVVETCPLPVKGAAFQRETVMTDRVTGRKLVQIYTSWMLVNTNDWKILRPAAFPYPLIRGEMDGDPNLFKWKVDTQQGEVVGVRPIYYSDLDNNGHANNAVYGDIATDFLPKGILLEKEVAAFWVHYQKEGALGEELTIHRAAIDEDHYDIWGEGPDSRCFEAKVALR